MLFGDWVCVPLPSPKLAVYTRLCGLQLTKTHLALPISRHAYLPLPVLRLKACAIVPANFLS